MASRSLTYWFKNQVVELDALEAAHKTVGGTGPGRRFATQQINYAYLLAVASEFQMFCRDLHQEAADIVQAEVPPQLQDLVLASLTQGRQLDRGNAHSGTIGSDFKRFGLDVWDAVSSLSAQNTIRQRRLDQLNTWRNAIAHRDFSFNPEQQKLITGTTPHLRDVRTWRSACEQLVKALDRAVGNHLTYLLGRAPF